MKNISFLRNPREIGGDVDMVTYQDLIAFTALIVEIVGLVFMIMNESNNKEK